MMIYLFIWDQLNFLNRQKNAAATIQLDYKNSFCDNSVYIHVNDC